MLDIYYSAVGEVSKAGVGVKTGYPREKNNTHTYLAYTIKVLYKAALAECRKKILITKHNNAWTRPRRISNVVNTATLKFELMVIGVEALDYNWKISSNM